MIHLLLLLIAQPFSSEQAMIESVMGLARTQGYTISAEFVHEEYGCTPYQWGMGIAQTSPRTATTWFKGLYEVDRVDDFLYGLAWSSWRGHNPLEALKILGGLTTSSDQLLRAQVFGLLGLIYEQEGKYDEAIKWLRQAILAYEERERLADVYSCTIQLARIMILTMRLDDARSQIEEASAVQEFQFTIDNGQVFELRCLLALATGAYGDAMTWAEQLLTVDDQEKTESGQAYLALSLALYGELEQANQVALELERNQGLYPGTTGILALAWARMAHCLGLDPGIFVKEFQSWEAKTREHHLLPSLNTILGEPCPP